MAGFVAGARLTKKTRTLERTLFGISLIYSVPRPLSFIVDFERTVPFGISLMYPEIEVEISNTQGHLQVDLAALDQLVRLVLAAEERPRGSISIALVDDATIHAINRTHLGHDWPTDVVTFPLGDPAGPVLSGELVVSVEMACAAAREVGVEPGEELALYVVHGLLHLCGYDDHDDADRCRMRQREDEMLSRAGLTNPYARGSEARPKPPDSPEGKAPPAPPGHRAAGPRLVTQELEGRPWTA